MDHSLLYPVVQDLTEVEYGGEQDEDATEQSGSYADFGCTLRELAIPQSSPRSVVGPTKSSPPQSAVQRPRPLSEIRRCASTDASSSYAAVISSFHNRARSDSSVLVLKTNFYKDTHAHQLVATKEAAVEVTETATEASSNRLEDVYALTRLVRTYRKGKETSMVL